MLLEDVGNRAIQILEELALSDLPGRPFDNAFGLFDPNKNRPPLIVIGLNGSMDDSKWTNRTAVQHGLDHPDCSNLQRGLEEGWGGSRKLPGQLRQVVGNLGFRIDQTIFTNTILTCSANAEAIRGRAQEFGMDLQSILEKSMEFHRRFTLELTSPKAILLHGNSLYNFSAANVWRQRMQTSEIHFLKSASKSLSYWFYSFINGLSVPTLCVPHMSRRRPENGALSDFCKTIARHE